MTTREQKDRPIVIEQIVDGAVTGKRFNVCSGSFVKPSKGTTFLTRETAEAVIAEFGILDLEECRVAKITKASG